MKEIIPPVKKVLLEAELKADRFVRYTNMGNNELYIVNHNNSPHTTLEIGRLRELTFRTAGGGTGKDADIDKYDIGENPYEQLLVWNPELKEIIGGYRFKICREHDDNYNMNVATAGLLHFSEQFKKDFLPYTIELGRSFVQPDYQTTQKARKGIFALDNLWDGLGALVIDNPNSRYFFGKVTIYQDYNEKSRDLLYHFMNKHCPDPDKLVYPKTPLEIKTNISEMEELLTGKTFEEDYKILSKTIRSYGSVIPPLINAYLGLSPTARTFGASINDYFGGVIESGLLVTIKDIYPEKTERHVNTYLAQKEKRSDR